MRLIVYPTGNQDTLTFGIVGFVLLVLTIFLITFLAGRKFNEIDARLFILLVVVGPIGLILFNRIGRNDSLMILGALIVVLGGLRFLYLLVGLLIMLLGNPEQTVVAFGILLILSFIPQLKVWRRRAITGLAIALITFVGLSMLARSVESKSRLEYLPDYLNASFYAFAANLPLSLYAGYAAFWLIAAWIFVQVRGRSRLLLVLALVVAPVSVTIITVDQTRVFVGVTTLAVFVLLKSYIPQMREYVNSLGFQPVLAGAVLIVLFLPVLDIWGTSGGVSTPYLWVFTEIVPQIKSFIVG
jgi:MFS family permease